MNGSSENAREYRSLMSGELTGPVLTELSNTGGLRTSKLRSIVWRIQLGCLPLEKSQWVSVIERSRNQYMRLKNQHKVDPRVDGYDLDPQTNNPLCSDESSPWKKYFADYELRDLISKDVNRTFPEVPLFHSQQIRNMMNDILLTYSKENPYLSYKQGMHEILAPLLFVLDADHMAFQLSKESKHLSFLDVNDFEILEVLYNERFLENDAYTMFCEVMKDIRQWFDNGEKNRIPPSEPTPFMRLQDCSANSAIITDLLTFEERLFKEDPFVAKHLRRLRISPQLYGIRWLRLLFGREFPIHDLLYLWDVILADRSMTGICECVFISLLIYIRALLLYSDYSGCLRFLMRYPPITDVSAFIRLVRYYRYPKRFGKPAIPILSNFAHITVAGTSHPNETARRQPFGQVEEPSGFRPKSRSVFSKVKNSIADTAGFVIMNSTKRGSPSTRRNISWEEGCHLLEQQVSALQTALNNRDVTRTRVCNDLDKLAIDVVNAENEPVRRGISDQLLVLKKILMAEQQADNPERIEVAREAQPAIEPPPLLMENELSVFKKSSNQ